MKINQQGDSVCNIEVVKHFMVEEFASKRLWALLIIILSLLHIFAA